MDDGDPHPSARAKVLFYVFAPGNNHAPRVLKSSITNFRLALLGNLSGRYATQLTVWNWITGEMLLVCQLLLDNRTLMWTVHLGARHWVLPVCSVC